MTINDNDPGQPAWDFPGPFIPEAAFANARALRRAAKAALSDWTLRCKRAVDRARDWAKTDSRGILLDRSPEHVNKYGNALSFLNTVTARGHLIWLQKVFAVRIPIADARGLSEWCWLQHECVSVYDENWSQFGCLIVGQSAELDDKGLLQLAVPLLYGSDVANAIESLPEFETWMPDGWCPMDPPFRTPRYVGEMPLDRLAQQTWAYLREIGGAGRPPEPIAISDCAAARHYLDAVIGWCELQTGSTNGVQDSPTANSQSTPASGSQEKKAAAHSIDFRSVNWFGTPYTFTGNQAACVKIWWEHWEQGTPEVGDDAVLEAADSAGKRINALFADCPAWGTMIVAGTTKGTHRLQVPAS